MPEGKVATVGTLGDDRNGIRAQADSTPADSLPSLAHTSSTRRARSGVIERFSTRLWKPGERPELELQVLEGHPKLMM